MHSTQHSALDENISAQLSVLSSDLLVNQLASKATKQEETTS